jgi:enoyl-CoA hydratase/carnithine racemase
LTKPTLRREAYGHRRHSVNPHRPGENRGMSIDKTDKGHGIRLFTMTGQGTDNKLTTADLLELAAQCDALRADKAARVVILAGPGAHFCGGRIGAAGLTSPAAIAQDLGAILQVNAAMAALSVPVIAAIEGRAHAFGFGLAAQSDYAIAGAGTELCLPEMSHGLPPLVVLSYLFRYTNYKRAFELASTSRAMSAADALAAGLVTETVAAGAALERALAVAAGMAASDQTAMTMLRRFARQAAAVHDPFLGELAVGQMSGLLADRAGKH